MWCIEGFDKETEQFVNEWPLRDLDEGTLRDILNVHDDDPMEPFDFEIPDTTTLRSLVKYVDGSFEIDNSMSYQLGYRRDRAQSNNTSSDL